MLGKALDPSSIGVWRQARPLSCGGVDDALEEEDEAVAVVPDARPVVADGVQVAEVSLDLVPDGGAREEGRGVVLGPNIVVDDEDAGQGERQEVLAQQAAGVDDGAPHLADGAADGEAAWRQTTEDVRRARRPVADPSLIG